MRGTAARLLLVVVGLLAGARGAAAQPRRAVVVFPFAARAPEQRIYGHGLARAVARTLEPSPRLRVIVAAQRPASEQPAALAAAARALGAEVAVVGLIEPQAGDQVRLRAVVLARGARDGAPAEVRASLERLDEGAGELARLLRPRLEAAAAPASAPASQTVGALLVYGVDAPVVAALPDVRVPATRAAYVFVRRRLRLRPVPDAHYGLVAVPAAAAAAAAAGSRGALLVRLERLGPAPGGLPATDGRVVVRVVAADGQRWRDRVMTVRADTRFGETRDRLAQRIVAGALERALPELDEVLGLPPR
jgi:TolB-like protein